MLFIQQFHPTDHVKLFNETAVSGHIRLFSCIIIKMLISFKIDLQLMYINYESMLISSKSDSRHVFSCLSLLILFPALHAHTCT